MGAVAFVAVTIAGSTATVDAQGDQLEAPAGTTSSATSEVPDSEVPPETTASTVEATTSAVVPETTAPVVEQPVEEVVDDGSDSFVEGETFVEEELPEETLVDEELEEPTDEVEAVPTTRLNFGAIVAPDRQESTSSLVTVVEGRGAGGAADSTSVVRLVMALLVVVGLLIATLTARYWWYTNPQRGLAPSRVVLPRGPGGWSPPSTGQDDVPDTEYVGAAVDDGPFVRVVGPPGAPQHVADEAPVVAEMGAADERGARRQLVVDGAELDDGRFVPDVGPVGATFAGDGPVGDELVGNRGFEHVEGEHPPAGLWQEPVASGARRRLREATTEAGGRVGRPRSDGAADRVVAAADVLSWADGPGDGNGRD